MIPKINTVDINFDNRFKARIQIINDELYVVNAFDGGGSSVDTKKVKITKVQ